MSGAQNIAVEWREDGSATALGRVTARGGAGAATGVNGEGNWVQQVDVSSITCVVYEEADGTEIATPAVVVASAVLDSPVTTNVLWTADAVGYNFLHDLPATAFPTGGTTYRAQYKFTMADGGVLWGVFVGPAKGVHGG